MPTQQAIVAGAPLFVTVTNLYANPTASNFTVVFDTDQACQAAVQWTADTDAPSIGGGPLTGTVADAGPVTHHSITVTPTQAGPGKTYIFKIALAATDSTGLSLRPNNDGFVQLTGARAAGQTAFGNNLSVPSRFYMYGDGSRPAGGGANKINWNGYTWAQYNPKGTTYPTP